MVRPVVLAACGLLVACGTTVGQPEATGTHTEAIVGGSPAPNDAQVFQLRISTDGTTVTTTCSATLIGARTLLTAAHCVDPKRFGVTVLFITASNAQDTNGTTDWVKAAETRLHPGWATLTLDHDLALVLLETSPGLTPMAWNAGALTGKGGAALRSLGYGATAAMTTSANVRRQVALTFRQIEADKIRIGDQEGAGICNGDSGGPSLHTFADGVERIVGVHSSAATSCVDGTDQRVDVEADFIRGFLMEKEPAACWDDGRCASGCATVDLDCVCGADGQCTDKCPSVLRDPDCPADCVENGVCSDKPCPRPDVDCGNFSGTCLKPQDCLSGRCVTDPQHTLPYCSAACSADVECPAAMECDGTKTCRYRQVPMLRSGAPCVPGKSLCEPASMCLPDGEGAATKCMRMCSRDADCAAPQGCSADGFCRAPVVLASAKSFEGQAAAGCSAAPGFFAWAALAWVLRRRAKMQ